jgi:autotransporter-associated beta strand protein
LSAAVVAAFLVGSAPREARAEAAWEFTTASNSFSNDSWNFGTNFTVTKSVTVSALGYYADPSTAFSSTHPVSLYSVKGGFTGGTGTLLTSATVTDADTLIGHFRYATIPTITLLPGDYQIDGVSNSDNYTWDDVGFSTSSSILYVGNTWTSVGSGGLPDFQNFVKDDVVDGYWGANLLLGEVAPLTPIDSSEPFFLASDLDVTVAPDFQGGTLRMDQTNGVFDQNFTLDGATTNTIDQFGNASTFSGIFADAVAGTPGNIVITNSGAGGSVTFSGANTYTGTTTIDQGATLIIGAGGSITNASTLFNSGGLQVDALGALTVGGITNHSTGAILNNGTITDALDNSGLVLNNAVYNADVNNFSTGIITNTGTWTGSLLSNSGSVLNSGTWSAATFVNDAGGFVATSGSLTATTSITNSGTFEAAGSLTTPLLDNTGTFIVTGPLSGSSGTFNNAGTVSMVDGVTTGVLAATTFNGQGGIVAIDVDPTSAAATQRADLVSTTNVSGTTGVEIHVVGQTGLIANPIPIVTAASVAPGTSIAVSNSSGLINYSIEQSGTNFNLVSTVNTSAVTAAPAGIDSILTALSTGFFQNASAFISEPAKPEPNQWNGGPWVRFADGRNDIAVQTSAQNPTGVAHAVSNVRAKFSGFQTGLDLGLANIENTGWNTHLGVTAGQVVLSTSDLMGQNLTSSVQVPFIGIYGALTGHNFFADFQVRGDFYNMQLSNPVAFLRNAGLRGSAFAVNGSAGYRVALAESWFVEPSIAFMYSQLRADSLRLNLDSTGVSFGYLDFDPFKSALGRVGARVGTSFLLEEQLVVQPFGTLSVWREFAGNSTTSFETPGATALLEVDRIGTFGQVGLGVAGQFVKSGILGFARGDYRFGDHISGYAAVLGLRCQF